MRVGFVGETIVRVDASLEVVREGVLQRLGAAMACAYSPSGALALSPDGATALHAKEGDVACKTDLLSGRAESLEMRWIDVAYADEETIVALLRDGDEIRVAELDAKTLTPRMLDLPAPTPIHWPYGTPYRFGVYVDEDWSSSSTVRISATRWGLVIAQSSGLVHVRRPNGQWLSWRVAFAYQGWICGYCHEHGVVFTSVHNGRTADVVWVDDDGIWYDCYASDWESMSPCVPCGRGFVAGLGDDLIRFEGYPATIVSRCSMGGRCEDMTTDPSGQTAVGAFESRLVRVTGDRSRVHVFSKVGAWEDDELEFVAEPVELSRIPYLSHLDPALGRLHCPDPQTVQALIDGMQTDPTVLDWLPGVQSSAEATNAVEAVLQALDRTPYRPHDKDTLLAVLARLQEDAPADVFVAWSLRQALPQAWRGLKPSPPFDRWLRDHVVLLCEGTPTAGVQRVIITADLDRAPSWGVRIERRSGRPQWIRLEEFEPGILAEGAVPDQDDSWDGMRGETTVDVKITPHNGMSFTVTIHDDDGETLLHADALFDPIVVSDPDDVRRLYYDANADGLFLGQRDGRWVVDSGPKNLEGVRPLSAPKPLPHFRERLLQMVADEWLALHACTEDLCWAVEVAVLGSDQSEGVIAQVLEDLLLEHDAVDDLFADTEQLRAAVVELRGTSTRPTSSGSESSGLQGRTICLTGTLQSMKRSEAARRCERAGARITSGITKTTDLLVAGEKAGSKLTKARAVGIEVIDEAEFLRRLG